MNQAIIMVEEQSFEEVTKIIVKRLKIEDQIKIIPHEGKSDLEKSFPRKIASWNNPQRIRFVICRDNDGSDCATLKERLRKLLPSKTQHEFKLRLVMNELESWYLGDLEALQRSGLITQEWVDKNRNKRKFRSPESLLNAKDEFTKLVKKKGQIALARAIAPHLDLNNNRCSSFKHFISAIKWATE